jgi:protein-disulfide isomerase
MSADSGELPVLTEVLDEFDLDSNALKTCLTKPETTQELQRLIEVARQLKITTTPSFFIAGRRFEGFVPMPLLRRALEELRK